MAALCIAVVALGSSGCGQQQAVAAKARLAVRSVNYDCATRNLTVTGTAAPALEGQDVQLQVRSEQFPKAPVWRIVETDAAGDFAVSGKFAVSSGEAIEVRVRLASVTGGVRVFSAVAVHEVLCVS